jgi:predicted nucleotidyltransferase
MIDRDYIVQTLQRNMTLLQTLGVRSVGLFGSYARGEQTAASDVDLLVDFERDRENFDNLMAVCDLLESFFAGHRIEVVTKGGLSQHIGPRILQEVEYV